MEVTKLSSDMGVSREEFMLPSFLEAAVVNTVVAAQTTVACLLMLVNTYV